MTPGVTHCGPASTPFGSKKDRTGVCGSTLRLFKEHTSQISGSMHDALDAEDVAVPVEEQMAVERFPDLDAADFENISDWFGGREPLI